jgi:hypothetical protein
MQQTSSHLFNLEKQILFLFFLYYILCKVNKYWENSKIKRKSLFKFSSYSHPEIWEFRGVRSLAMDYK